MDNHGCEYRFDHTRSLGSQGRTRTDPGSICRGRCTRVGRDEAEHAHNHSPHSQHRTNSHRRHSGRDQSRSQGMRPQHWRTWIRCSLDRRCTRLRHSGRGRYSLCLSIPHLDQGPPFYSLSLEGEGRPGRRRPEGTAWIRRLSYDFAVNRQSMQTMQVKRRQGQSRMSNTLQLWKRFLDSNTIQTPLFGIKRTQAPGKTRVRKSCRRR